MGLNQIMIPIGREESSRRGALDLVTTHPEEATLVKSKNSGPLIWTPLRVAIAIVVVLVPFLS